MDYDYDEDGVSDVFNSTYLCIAAYANRPLNVVVLIAAGADIDALSDADPVRLSRVADAYAYCECPKRPLPPVVKM